MSTLISTILSSSKHKYASKNEDNGRNFKFKQRKSTASKHISMKSPTSSKGKNMLNTVADRNKSVENDCEKEMRFKSRKTGFINIYKSIKK